MSVRYLCHICHPAQNGTFNAPAHKLFEAVTIQRKDETKPARAFTDYTVTIDRSAVPQGIEIIERI